MAGALYCFSACLQALRSALNVSQQAVPVLKDGVLVGGEVLDVTVDPGDLAGGLQPSALGSGVTGVGVTQGAFLSGGQSGLTLGGADEVDHTGRQLLQAHL